MVNEHYPGLAFHLDSEGRQMCLEGDFILEADCGVPTPIRIRIEFRSNYPVTEPVAYDAAGYFPTSLDRHILKDGQFCLWLPPCSPWNKDDPHRLLRFLDEVTVFLERQLVYDATGGTMWPGPQYKHGTDGYEEFMLSLLGDNQAHLRSLFPSSWAACTPHATSPVRVKTSRSTSAVMPAPSKRSSIASDAIGSNFSTRNQRQRTPPQRSYKMAAS